MSDRIGRLCNALQRAGWGDVVPSVRAAVRSHGVPCDVSLGDRRPGYLTVRKTRGVWTAKHVRLADTVVVATEDGPERDVRTHDTPGSMKVLATKVPEAWLPHIDALGTRAEVTRQAVEAWLASHPKP